MTILLDCRPIRPPVSGVARYCIGLANALHAAAPGEVHALAQGEEGPGTPLSQLTPSLPRLRLRLGRSRKLQNIFLESGLSSFLRSDRTSYRIVHETYFARSIQSPRAVRISTIHDTIPIDFPELFSPTNRAFSELNFYRQCNDSEHIICVSNYTRDRVIELGNVDAARISVIGCGVQDVPLTADSNSLPDIQLGEPYILFIGNIEPRKNLATLIRAVAALPPQFSRHKLLVAGRQNYLSEADLDLGRKLLGERFAYLGPVSEAVKWTLINHTELIVFPSLYEGFGIPILEAYKSKRPILFANNSAMSELAVSPRQMFDALSVEELADAIDWTISNPTEVSTIVRDAHQFGLPFTWDSVAARTMAIYSSYRG